MSRLFNRVVSFRVEGEIDDKTTSPEDIINNYDWFFEDNEDGNIQLFAYHKDNRGMITNMTRLPKVQKWKTSDTEFLLNR